VIILNNGPTYLETHKRRNDMNNFVFSIPTTAYFGKGQISVLGETIRQHGGSKVLLAYGGGSIKANGVYDATIEQLNNAGLAYVELSGIQPNPRIESVEEGIRLYHENGCDFILGVGGGSTLDACKGIAAGVKYDGSVSDLFRDETGLSPISAAAPLATILTMAGTGSELDMGAVITVGADHKKICGRGRTWHSCGNRQGRGATDYARGFLIQRFTGAEKCYLITRTGA